MAQEAMTTGLRVMKDTQAEVIIISTAYHTWNDEARLQVERAKKDGIDIKHVRIIKGVRNSYNEALEASRKARALGASRLIVIAERWHAPRSLKAFRYACSDLKIEVVTFKTPWFETSYEPSMIKSLRSSTWLSWVAWNVLLGFVPPRLLGAKKAA